MKVGNRYYQTLWTEKDRPGLVFIIDQNALPFDFSVVPLETFEEARRAISEMQVRGAPVIGACGAAAVYLFLYQYDGSADHLKAATEAHARKIKEVRPTAVNLQWAVDSMMSTLDFSLEKEALTGQALQQLEHLLEEEKQNCHALGKHGLELIRDLYDQEGRTVHILTHCNAGWLACIDYGTALAPVYLAHKEGIPVHVWVDETRPRNQGARLTTWELQQQGIPCTLIADNTGGLLMQKKMVDLVFTGSDRTTSTGDVANKVGTYLKALAAMDTETDFYVVMPSSSIDFRVSDGLKEIPIEERDEEEVKYIRGLPAGDPNEMRVLLCPPETAALNMAFDITPSRLITGLITERGICMASAEGLQSLFPEKYKY